jgi:hypothetical protein
MNASYDLNDLNLPCEMQLFHQGVPNDARITTLTHSPIDAFTPECRWDGITRPLSKRVSI